MTQMIGIISDVHATAAPVQEALSIFYKIGVEMILCAGDIAGYGEQLDQTIKRLVENGCRAILGNHDAWYLERPPKGKETDAFRFLAQLPRVLTLTIKSRKLSVVHASPPQSMIKGIHLLDENSRILPDRKKFWDS